jgi:hypothetical protein
LVKVNKGAFYDVRYLIILWQWVTTKVDGSLRTKRFINKGRSRGVTAIRFLAKVDFLFFTIF